jgi:uncharacterized phiE125 gp8 family phage protein
MEDLVLITPPAVEPVSLYQLKLQCGLSPVEDQDHIKEKQVRDQLRPFITIARTECENRTRRVFITQTWLWKLDGFPCPNRHYAEHWERHGLKLPKQPFQSLGSVQYVDTTGALQTLAQDTDYGNGALPQYSFQLDPGSDHQPARIAPSWLVPWPPTRYVQSNVLIQFTAGYGDTGASVPAPITQAILFLAHSYYDPTAYKNVDALVDSLLNPYVNRIS